MPLRTSNMLDTHAESVKEDLHTALPGKIISYDPKTQTCVAQPIMQDEDGLAMPPIYDVPVIFPAGGGAVLSFPVKPGEKCWLSYSMYPISDWVRSDGKANQNMNRSRTHDMNECVAFVGLGTVKENYQPHPNLVMLRFGKTSFTMDDAGTVNITGKLIVSDTITGKDFISSDTGVTFNNHVHHYYWTDPGGEADSQKPQ